MAPTTPPAPHADSAKTGPDRRTVVGAAAWAAPAIVLSVASPAAASSLGTITASPVPITAGAPKSTTLQLTPAADGVPISLTVEPQGSITWPADVVTLPGLGGRASVVFSTALTEAQSVMVTAVAPGYAPVTFPLTIEAAPRIVAIDVPDEVMFDPKAQSSKPLELALEPAAPGVPVTLTRETGANGNDLGCAAYSLISDAAGHVRTTVGAMLDKDDTPAIIASAPGYESLRIPIRTLSPQSSTDPAEPGEPGGRAKTHTAYRISVLGYARVQSWDQYTLGDNPIVVTLGIKPEGPGVPTKATVKGQFFSGDAGAMEVVPDTIVIDEGGSGAFTIRKLPGARSGQKAIFDWGNYGHDVGIEFTVQ